MKKILAFFMIVTLVIIACNSSKKTKLLYKPGDAPAHEYVINIEKDTTLVTKNGALLEIPKGALSTDKGSTVTLEIKEAYSIEQMLKAGLTTQSNGELLSSGGMIYINAKGGQNVKITQAIRVAVPSDYLDPGMKLFKGNPDNDGNMNWTDPDTLPANPQLPAIEKGKALFMSKCASCHKIGKDGAGPDLAHFPRRIPYGEGSAKYWYHYFRHSYVPYTYDNNHKVDSLYEHRWIDPYACNLIGLYGGKAYDFSSWFDKNTDTVPKENLFDIYSYIQNESDKNGLPLPSHAWLDDCIDSCEAYDKTVRDLQSQKEIAQQKKDELAKDNGKRVVEEKNIPADPAIPAVEERSTGPVDFDEKVSPENYDAVYYQFTIETFGWYNIDVLVKGINGVEESELFVRIIGEYREKVQVYLIIPSAKIYVQGGPAERNAEEFAFLYKNGKISLPQGVKAYIMAVSEQGSSISFALKEFNTTTRQEFEISLQKSGKEEFNAAIKRIGGDSITISVKDTKNAGEIRKKDMDLETIDEEIKKTGTLKPKNCDCNCGTAPANMLVRDSATAKTTVINRPE